MTWLKLDDGFDLHPKIVGLSDGAFRSHVRAMLYASRYLTDGVIPSAAVGTLATAKERRELMAAGVWDETSDGITIHDFLVYNPTRAKVEEEREKTAERVREWRARRNDKRNDVTPDEVSNGVTDVSNAVTNGAPVPTRPDPSHGEGPDRPLDGPQDATSTGDAGDQEWDNKTPEQRKQAVNELVASVGNTWTSGDDDIPF